jgi:uncharacterized membrane protein YwzB
MQLFPWNVPDASTFPQLVKKGYSKLMWAIILSRVFGYCIKNYYMAELATAEVLKNQKK